jgi:hypothetical protein
MTDAEIIELIRAYALQKKYIELLEEQIERMLDVKRRRNKRTREKKPNI